MTKGFSIVTNGRCLKRRPLDPIPARERGKSVILEKLSLRAAHMPGAGHYDTRDAHTMRRVRPRLLYLR